jgi:tRNA(fMet)-specific endonuclease VapC
MRFMLDTNICIYIIKKKPLKVLERLRTLDVTDVAISSITLSELEYGVAKSSQPEQNRDALSAFLVPLEIIPRSACGIPLWRNQDIPGKERDRYRRYGYAYRFPCREPCRHTGDQQHAGI